MKRKIDIKGDISNRIPEGDVKWVCEQCGVTVNLEPFDYDLCNLNAYYENGRFLGVIYPNDIETMIGLIESIDNGECPICNGWEDCCGNNCSSNGWGEYEINREEDEDTVPFVNKEDNYIIDLRSTNQFIKNYLGDHYEDIIDDIIGDKDKRIFVGGYFFDGVFEMHKDEIGVRIFDENINTYTLEEALKLSFCNEHDVAEAWAEKQKGKSSYDWDDAKWSEKIKAVIDFTEISDEGYPGLLYFDTEEDAETYKQETLRELERLKRETVFSHKREDASIAIGHYTNVYVAKKDKAM